MRTTILFLLLSTAVLGQSNSSVGLLSKNWTPKLTGAINASTAYNSNFLSNRLNYFLSGNINLQWNKLVIPASFNYSDRKFQFSQAYTFNQGSINPSYKWASAQIGITNSNFSPYSLNGHQYTGIGLNLRPSKWDIQLMGGRLLKATSEDTLTGPQFTRMGYGAKVAVQLWEELRIGTTFFYAEDRENSLANTERNFNGLPINPSSNLVVGLDLLLRPTDFIEWKINYHNSLLNESRGDSLENIPLRNSPAGWFLQPKAGSRVYNALKTDLNFKLGTAILGLGYEKIDPDYRTLGGYYFVNDLKNYTLNFSNSFFKQQWTLSSSIGLQEDDIASTKSTSQRRFIGTVNSQIRLKNNLSISSSYSNLQSFMFIRDAFQEVTQVPGIPIDTLDYSQISQNFQTSVQKRFRERETYQSGIGLQFNLADAQGRNGPILREETQSRISNLTFRYNIALLQSNTDIGASLTFNQNAYSMGTTRSLGPGIQLSQSLLEDKIKLSLNTNILFSSRNGESINAYNTFMNGSFQPSKKHIFRLNGGFVASSIRNNYQNINLSYGLFF